MHHPTDRIAHTMAFVTPVVEHWLEREIAQLETGGNTEDTFRACVFHIAKTHAPSCKVYIHEFIFLFITQWSIRKSDVLNIHQFVYLGRGKNIILILFAAVTDTYLCIYN